MPAVQAAIVTVSDSRASGQAPDTAGPAVRRLLEDRLGAQIAACEVIPDDVDTIARLLVQLAKRGLDLLCTVGGTGFGPRDVTPEATRRILQREAPGLAEAMRAASLLKTPYAALQRGVSGIRGRTLILNLPGSEKGATENLEAIIGSLDHAIQLLRGADVH